MNCRSIQDNQTQGPGYRTVSSKTKEDNIMTTQVVINGKEVTNPIAKATFVFGAILIAALITAVVVFVLLPIIGIAVTLSAGLVAISIVAIIAGIATLITGVALFAWFFGPAELRVKKSRNSK